MQTRMLQETVTYPREAPPGRAIGPTDGTLLRRAAGGDRVAFRSLHRRYERYVYWLARRMVGATSAEDVAQEAWLRVHTKAGDLTDGDLFRAWLRSIVVRCCLDRRRRRSAAVRGTGLPEELPGGDAARPTLRLDLERALQRLPRDMRLAVVLHDIEGMAHAEVAAALGISEEASRARLSRARRTLREHLGES